MLAVNEMSNAQEQPEQEQLETMERSISSDKLEKLGRPLIRYEYH